MTELEAKIAELRAQLEAVAERVRIDAIAEDFCKRATQPTYRVGDYVLIDGFPTKISSFTSDGKWGYFNGRNYIEPFRVPPSEDIERLYTVAEVAEIVAKARPVEWWERLSDAERHDLSTKTCRGCGSLDKRCQCWNAE